MQIPLDRAVSGLVAYMRDLVSQISNPLEQFAGHFILGSLENNSSGLVAKLRPWMEMSGVLSGNMVNLDSLKTAMDNAFANVPKLSYLGWTFTADDTSALLAKIQ